MVGHGHHYAQVPHPHHYSHSHGHHHTHNYYNSTAPTTHINIYSNAPLQPYGVSTSVGNFSLSDAQQAAGSQAPHINLSLNIKLDLNDFKAPSEPAQHPQQAKSWVDDWK